MRHGVYVYASTVPIDFETAVKITFPKCRSQNCLKKSVRSSAKAGAAKWRSGYMQQGASKGSGIRDADGSNVSFFLEWGPSQSEKLKTRRKSVRSFANGGPILARRSTFG